VQPSVLAYTHSYATCTRRRLSPISNPELDHDDLDAVGVVVPAQS
jgi:hypothetical protein